MKKTDLNYIAGLFDGEGSIVITKRKESGKIRIQTSITNTDIDVLNFVKEIIKLGVIGKNIDTRANFPVHRWITSDGHSYMFLKIILPYIKIKKNNAENVIKQYESEKWRKIKFYS